MDMRKISKFDEKYCEMATEWLADGGTLADFADSIGVSRVAVWEWQKKHDTLLTPYKKGAKLRQI